MGDPKFEIQKMDLRDGDVVVLSTPERLSTAEAVRAAKTMEAMAATTGKRVTVLVLDGGAKLGLLRGAPEGAPAPAAAPEPDRRQEAVAPTSEDP